MVADPEDLKPVPRDGKTIGEIMVRGNTVMLGYLKEPKATAEAFRGGWMHTGDLAVEHPDGYVEIKDRAKDIIISGGENISSVEVEIALYRHPAVQLAAVVARPDEKWGETPCAFVQLKPGANAMCGRDHHVLPRTTRALQGAEDGGVRPAADDGDRQDPEIHAAGTGAGPVVRPRSRRPPPIAPRSGCKIGTYGRRRVSSLLSISRRQRRYDLTYRRRCSPARRGDRIVSCLLRCISSALALNEYLRVPAACPLWG